MAGVIPSSSLEFNSFRLASWIRSKNPSRAALWKRSQSRNDISSSVLSIPKSEREFVLKVIELLHRFVIRRERAEQRTSYPFESCEWNKNIWWNCLFAVSYEGYGWCNLNFGVAIYCKKCKLKVHKST